MSEYTFNGNKELAKTKRFLFYEQDESEIWDGILSEGEVSTQEVRTSDWSNNIKEISNSSRTVVDNINSRIQRFGGRDPWYEGKPSSWMNVISRFTLTNKQSTSNGSDENSNISRNFGKKSKIQSMLSSMARNKSERMKSQDPKLQRRNWSDLKVTFTNM